MSTRLNRLLEHILEGEPEIGDEVDAVFREADRLARRRTRMLIASAAAAVAGIAIAGILVTTSLLPGPPAVVAPSAATSSAVPMPSSVADPVLALLAPAVDSRKMRIVPRPPDRGNGWRQYSVSDDKGPRGTIQVAVYTVKDDLCFPIPDAEDECAKTEWAPKGVEYVRYDYDQDAGWQVHQTIARQISDGRTVALMATGERDADSAAAGKPALTGKQIEKIATDPRLFTAFGGDEDCFGTSAGACPAFKVAVPD